MWLVILYEEYCHIMHKTKLFQTVYIARVGHVGPLSSRAA